ncbi:MAG TPA: hypothetical protein PKH68_01365 [Paludibacteraceae bacterium]|nr:hypothetical protein [Paludibacteraceae bacterium]
MAYGLKYILRYETQRFGTDIRVLIYEKDYTGPSQPKRIGADHIRLSRDKDGQICGTTLDFSIQADTDMEFANFFTLDNKAHKVELEFNWGVVWTGFVVSDQYSEPFVAPPYDVQVMATDGLGLLKNEKFELTGMVSRFEAIRYCIDKIGIALPYAININIWEQNMNISGHNMLDQLYFHAEILRDKTCYEAIQALLPENVFINQANGYWMIERPTDRTLPRYIFNADGTPSNEEYNWHTFLRELNTVQYSEIHRGSLYPIGSLTLEMQSAWRKFTIKQIFGKRESFFRNHDFKAGTTYWENVGLGANFYAKNVNEENLGVLAGYQNSYVNHISQSIDVISTSAITLEINYALVGVSPIGGNINFSKFNPNVKFQLKLAGTSGQNYYLDQQGWNTSAKEILIEKVPYSFTFEDINFQSTKINAAKLPESGVLTITIYQVIPNSNVKAYENWADVYKGLFVKKVIFYNNDITQFNDSEETTVILNENATESEKTIELKPTDIPNYENNNLYFDNGNYVKVNGKYIPTKSWGSQQKTYLEYMSAYMAYLYQSSRSVLKGEISGWLELNSYVVHYLTNKIYLIDKGTWNVLDHTFTLDLIELPAGEFIYDNYAQNLPEPFVPHVDISDVNDFIVPIDGSFEVPLTGTHTPLIVARAQTIDPLKLDFDSGTPQFSIKDAVVETNVGDNANAVKIGAGEIISHHYAALDRTSIRFIKEANEQYDPTRAWDIAETNIELPDNDGYFLYVKVPLAEQLPE